MRGKLLLVFLCLIYFFAIYGCASFVIKTQTDFKFVKPEKPPEFFNVPRSLPDIKFENPTEKDRKFAVQKFSFESWEKSGFDKNDKINGFFYLPAYTKNSDLFIVLPGSGEDIAATAVAEILASMGYKTIRIKSGFKPLPKILINELAESSDASAALKKTSIFLVSAVRQRIIDLMRLGDFWETSMTPTRLKIHVVGISLGGIIGSLFSAVDQRVESLMMINSSASIARILTDSKMSGFKPFRENLMKKLNLSYEETYQLIKEKITPVEPITYAERLNPEKILMVNAWLDMLGIIDTAIPYSATKETWEAFGKPEWITMPLTGHVSSFFALLPFWIELPNPLHTIKSFAFDNSYAVHLIKNHFLPKALKN